MTRRRAPTAGVLAALVAGALMPLTGDAQAPSTLTVLQGAAITPLGPAGAGISLAYPAGDEAAFLVYDGLVRFTDRMTIIPQLATSWSVSSDGRTWTFKIRDGVSFQDGSPLTAQAVVDDFNREVDHRTNQSNRPLWDPIASVSAPDPATVQIVTTEPYGALLNTLAHHSALIAGPKAVDTGGPPSMAHPVGTGPYQVYHWDVGTQLEVLRNPRFWGGRAGYDRIVLRNVPDPGARVAMIRSAEAQIAEGIPPGHVDELQRAPGVTVIVKPALRTFGMEINLNRPALRDVRVRQALNYAVNKELLVNALFRGNATVLRSPLAPQTSADGDAAPWPYDPPKARVLLEQAGWKPAPPIGVRVKDGRALELTLLTPQGMFPRDVEVVETLADYLRNVGFEVHFLYVEAAGFWDRLLIPPDQYAWDLVFFGFAPANGDGGLQLDALYRSNPDRRQRPRALNVTGYANPQVDAWLTEGRRAIDPRTRAAAYARVERTVWTDVPSLWLYAEDVIVATRDVKGVEILPSLLTILRAAHP
jgi:ABC-type transport system substrate-binding protein